jgi:hypothetical protein
MSETVGLSLALVAIIVVAWVMTISWVLAPVGGVVGLLRSVGL